MKKGFLAISVKLYDGYCECIGEKINHKFKKNLTLLVYVMTCMHHKAGRKPLPNLVAMKTAYLQLLHVHIVHKLGC